MGSIKLSVLVCGLYERMPEYQAGQPIVDLTVQSDGKPVEVLTLYDNRKMSVGRKRSILLAAAQGDYFTFVDDDDEVAEDYVSRLLGAIEAANGTDVLTFKQECHHADTGLVEYCTYGLGRPYGSIPRPGKPLESDWFGLPAHTQCWRTDLVQDIPFPDGDFGEDVGWVKQACARARTEYAIPDWTGYVYRFDPERSRTRGK